MYTFLLFRSVSLFLTLSLVCIYQSNIDIHKCIGRTYILRRSVCLCLQCDQVNSDDINLSVVTLHVCLFTRVSAPVLVGRHRYVWSPSEERCSIGSKRPQASRNCPGVKGQG